MLHIVARVKHAKTRMVKPFVRLWLTCAGKRDFPSKMPVSNSNPLCSIPENRSVERFFDSPTKL